MIFIILSSNILVNMLLQNFFFSENLNITNFILEIISNQTIEISK